MVDRFCNAPTFDAGSIPYNIWCETVLDKHTMTGDEKVRVVNAVGKIQIVSRKDAAIVFTDLKYIRNNKHNNTGSVAVTGKMAPHLVSLTEAYRATFGLIKHIIVNKNTCVIPLGTVSENENDRSICQQSARFYLSLCKNDINMADEHYGNMMMCILHATVWSMCENLKDNKSSFYVLNLLVQSFSAYMQRYPEAYNIITPIRYDDMARDTLQKCIAQIFFDDKPGKDEILRSLETVLKRSKKYAGESAVKLSDNPGLIGCFIISPLLRKAYREKISAVEISELLSAALGDVKKFADVVKVDKNVGTDEDGFMLVNKKKQKTVTKNHREVNIIVKILSLGGNTDVKFEDVLKVYKHATDPNNYFVFADFTDIIPKPDLTFVIGTDLTYNSNKLRQYNKFFAVDKSVKIYSSAPNEWCGFTLHDNGVYTFRANLIGPSIFNAGNTHDMIFTCGSEINPTKRSNKTAHGIDCKITLKPNGTVHMAAVSHGASLDFTRQFDITVTDEHFEIVQNGTLYYTLNRSKNEPVVIAYKWLELSMAKIDK
ncbi:MAG: hypothetical protein Faunusvirus1_55 [Faunusvirus sp.]|jgi:hypothetical protein|uniref:Uncharacterized protein n=1 Tax=Faunusvirus sp. TaxID=2487766 RepID=A0A3G4ZVW3_9VIRU|nr:MAG: hypothetical protein Faunusvirus1_55 [Faunusvirus sp.]